MCFFFFNDTATTEIYTLSLHDALPIFRRRRRRWPSPRSRAAPRPGGACRLDGPLHRVRAAARGGGCRRAGASRGGAARSEEHTSELQSRQYLVCRLLLEKKKTYTYQYS